MNIRRSHSGAGCRFDLHGNAPHARAVADRPVSRFPATAVRPACLLMAFAISWLLAGGQTSEAQWSGRAVPRPRYYLAIAELYRGDYRRAERDFRGELRSAIKTVQSHWIDSICHHTMLGECYYTVAQYDRALEHYDAALNLYLAFPNWMVQVKFPPSIGQSASLARRVVPWGQGERAIRPGVFSDTMLVMQGRIDNSDVVRQGGIVQMAQFMPVNVAEIVRATALSMWRRRELMGPVARHDGLTDELVAAFSRRPGRPNHWSEAWIDVQLGLAHAMNGDAVQAQQYLTRSLLIGGSWDHPLTGRALTALGQLALESGDYPRAARMFDEATRSAFYFDNYVVIEDAFRLGLAAHLMTAAGEVYSPLAPAAAWAQSRRARQLEAGLRLLMADNALAMRQPQQAQGQLAGVRSIVGRRDMSRGILATRLNFLTAATAYQQRRPGGASDALQAALSAMAHGSKWLFQIHLADDRYYRSDGQITPRLAMELYGELLRDPTGPDWSLDPLESMAVLVTPHRNIYEHWFDAALRRKEVSTAIEIADRARRHTFHASLPLGGRLSFLRSILETPASQLPQQAALQRQNLLARYPAYDTLSKQARPIRQQLAAGPLVPADQEKRDARSRQWRELARISSQQEEVLREMAVARVASDPVFPPSVSTKELQQRLPDGQALLAWFATSERMHGFLLTNQGYRNWSVGSAKSLRRGVVGMLRQIGNFDGNREVGLTVLSRDDWKASSDQVVGQMFEHSKVDLARGIDELVIVPDSFLWYLPFESLVVGKQPRRSTLISRMRIRYAPTVGLSLPLQPRYSSIRRTAVVVGKLYPRDSQAIAEEAFREVARVVPDTVLLRGPLPAASPVIGSLVQRLIVLDDIESAGPYDWAPIRLDHPESVGALRNWFRLPWGGPRQILLPGFHTAAESSLKRNRSQASGQELFLSICGLMSCGARTVLLSRWRTGGQSSFDLVREFVQELPHTRAADAWQRSVELSMVQPVQPDPEPRLGRS
ncbi:MAG: tetratricopeptide repeat protein, partial [Pirellulales bacterium]